MKQRIQSALTKHSLLGALIGGAIVAAGFLLVDYFGTGEVRAQLVSWDTASSRAVLRRGEKVLAHTYEKGWNGYILLISKD